jgi:hypothetical protein
MKDFLMQLQPVLLYVIGATILIWVLNQTKTDTWLKAQIEALNLISPTLLGFSAIVIGAWMCTKPANSSTGNQLITGGFALITGAKLQEHRDRNALTRSTDQVPTAPPPVSATEQPKVEGGV